MSRRPPYFLVTLLVILVVLTGCHPTQPFYLHEKGELEYYLDHATFTEHPDVNTIPLEDAANALPPRTILDPDFKDFWDLSLEECVNIALHNSKVIRELGAVTRGAVGDQILRSPETTTTVYDSAVSETNVGGTRGGGVDRGSRGNGAANVRVPPHVLASQVGGVEDALSEFDAQFFTSVYYNKTDRPRNVNPPGGPDNPFNNRFFQSDVGQFDATLSKKTATGGMWIVRNRTDYEWNNIPIGPGRAVPSDWTTALEIEVQHPLLQGYGVQVNRIPIVLARINTDITIAEFEAAARDLVYDVETAYWDLHCAYRILEAAKQGRNSALDTWQRIQALAEGGQLPAFVEGRAREQYYFLKAQVEAALTGSNVRDTGDTGLFNAESRLRYLMGLAATDCRVIRPIDEPTAARVDFAWCDVLCESLTRTAELREQKWKIKQRELELIAARNKMLPQLNVSGLYRWVGVGDHLSSNDSGVPPVLPSSNALAELTGGDFQEAALGVEFIPHRFGSRRELSGVRNAQVRLARDKALLEDMELNVTHQLAEAIRVKDSHYQQAQTHFNRHIGADEDVEGLELDLERRAGGAAGTQTQLAEKYDRLLAAQLRRMRAQRSYWEAMCEHTKAIALVHLRKGSLLEYNSVALAEGPWPKPAYWDAYQHARRRDASTWLNYGDSRPSVVSQGPVEMVHPGHAAGPVIDEEGIVVPPPVDEMVPYELEAPVDDSQAPSIVPGPVPSPTPDPYLSPTPGMDAPPTPPILPGPTSLQGPQVELEPPAMEAPGPPEGDQVSSRPAGPVARVHWVAGKE